LAAMFQPAWIRPANRIRAKACSDIGTRGSASSADTGEESICA
jgi:hypothetical protein